jgi:protein required for attachment to host cells
MLGDFLDKARAENRFVELVLIAPPKFLGMLRRSLSREAQKLVKAEIPKQLSRLDASEIEGYVKGAQSQ